MTSQERWLFYTFESAVASKHIFPAYAACEAALESAWGESELAREGLNLFGMKSHVHPEYGTLNLPTDEYLNDRWVKVDATWVKYPTVQACFEDRMNTLLRLQKFYPNYRNALAAGDGGVYVHYVSLTWSTDPKRAEKVMAIYNAHGASLK